MEMIILIFGNTDGIKNTVLDTLDRIYKLKIPKYSIYTEELAQILNGVTIQIKREISVAIDRKGQIISVTIGDSTTVEMPEVDIKDRKLSGVRIIHTHPTGYSMLSALDMSALIKMRLDCIAAIGVREDNHPETTIGFCLVENNILYGESVGPLTIEEAEKYDILDKIKYVEEFLKNGEIHEDNTERAILVGIEDEESLHELYELAKACNVIVAERIFQKRSKIDTAHFIGIGKVEELALLRQALKANLIIFDDELSGSQVRNLEELTGVKVIDRTTLILEIFASRAKTKEAKLQVEAAQLRYRMPRLSGLGIVLSRTGGGIGTKGPGEKKLEIDRRRIRERMYDLNKELQGIKKTRETQREKRNKGDIPQISIVGYTNAGKSTLRNTLCALAMPKDNVIKENVFEADMLFATLDVTTRAIMLPDNRLATISDTVGFIRKLPHDLVESFKSTLEEVIYCDLLLHVVDAASPNALEQIEAVDVVLKELKAFDKPTIILLNKIDMASEEQLSLIKSTYEKLNIIEISAKNKINLDVLLQEITKAIPYNMKRVEYLIPYSEQSIVAFLHRSANIESEEFKEDGTAITAFVNDEVYNKCTKYTVNL